MSKRHRYYSYEKVCEQCFAKFKASRYDARYCCANCRQRHRRKMAKILRADDAILEAMAAYLEMQENHLQYEAAKAALQSFLDHDTFLNV